MSCFVGCETKQIAEALGLTLRDLFDDSDQSVLPPPRRKLEKSQFPADRLLQRLREAGRSYRCAGENTPGFWTTTCKDCGGEVWIHAELDEENQPSGPVTVSCAEGCERPA